MAAEKYFAIRYRNGTTSIRFGYWDMVKPHVQGKSGVIFKGFSNKKDAESWIAKESVVYAKDDGFMKTDVIYLFVDGSYSTGHRAAGWGWVCVKNNKILGQDHGVVYDGPIESRNIVGELKATMEAVAWAIERFDEFTIVHDYMGISSWPLGYWSARKFVSRAYNTFMLNKTKDKKVSFIKVGGHRGIRWNEYADSLAKKGYKQRRSFCK